MAETQDTANPTLSNKSLEDSSQDSNPNSQVVQSTSGLPESDEDGISETKKVRKFPVIEIFGPTIQGEGSVIGMQTTFIRFGGCDYRCERCDSLHAVLPALVKKNATYMTAFDIFCEIEKLDPFRRMVTLSGGNPAMHDLDQLVDMLHESGREVAVETQGTLLPTWLDKVDYLTVSPKGPGMGEQFEYERFDVFMQRYKHAYINNQILPLFAVKIVIFDQQDIEFAKNIAGQWSPAKLYLSVGNPWPPAPAKNDSLEDADKDMSLSDALLERMRVLYDDISKEPLLSDAIFLPQLHALLWGNEQGR